jgi:hypothetical protein
MRVFDRNKINNLFNLSKRSFVTTYDGHFFLYRIDHQEKHEIRIENEYLTLKRFYLSKDLKAKSNLVKVLKGMGIFAEVYSKTKRGQKQ